MRVTLNLNIARNILFTDKVTLSNILSEPVSLLALYNKLNNTEIAEC